MSRGNVTSYHVLSFHGLQCLQAVLAVMFQNWDVRLQLWPQLAKPASDLCVLAYRGGARHPWRLSAIAAAIAT